MRLTKEGDYICRIIRCLSKSYDYMPAKYISEQEHISKGEVLKLLHKLVNLNIVESKKGSQGGYKLIINIKEVTLLDMISLLDKDIYISECMKPNVVCINNVNRQCKIHKKLLKLQNKIYEEFKSQTLYEILYEE